MNNMQDSHPDNYFSLLGLEIRFNIDLNKLTDNYHELQRSIHPDKFANASDRERRLSVQKAAQINDAFQTLKNPTQRSIYLLSLYGIELSENNNNVDPAFLMEQMELRESLSQVADKSDPFAELDIILLDVKSKIKQTLSELERLFQNILSAVENKENNDILLKQATASVLKMQFLNRLQEECLNKEEDLADKL